MSDFTEQYDELIATLTAHGIGAAYAGLQANRYRFKQSVTDCMSRRIVNVFESIDVEVKDCQPHFVPMRHRHRLGESVVEEDSVWQVRETIVLR
jgi:hypothetical protein